MHLTPFTQVHLTSSRWLFNLTPPGSWTTVYGVIAIGVLILLVACFNFMNLATARAMLRAREIALRKTMGASRGQLIVQFLGEAVLMALLALVLAWRWWKCCCRPSTVSCSGRSRLRLSSRLAAAAGSVGCRGDRRPGQRQSIPPWCCPASVPPPPCATNSAGQAGSGTLRNMLVVLQFAVSIGLGIAAAVVFSQISYARNIDLGFRRDNIVVIDAPAA